MMTLTRPDSRSWLYYQAFPPREESQAGCEVSQSGHGRETDCHSRAGPPAQPRDTGGGRPRHPHWGAGPASTAPGQGRPGQGRLDLQRDGL